MPLSPGKFLGVFGALTAATIAAVLVSAHATAELREQAAAGAARERALVDLRNHRDALAAQQPGTDALEQAHEDALAVPGEEAALAALRAEHQRTALNAMRRTGADSADARPLPNRVSPEATLQSVIQSVTDGEADELAGVIDFDAAAQAEADAFFASLPEDVRTQFDSSARLVAHVMTAKTPRDIASTRVTKLDEAAADRATLHVQLTRTNGTDRSATFVFHRTADGWRLRVPAKVIEGYRALVTDFVPATVGPAANPQAVPR